mgnify:CR=1 FL=1
MDENDSIGAAGAAVAEANDSSLPETVANLQKNMQHQQQAHQQQMQQMMNMFGQAIQAQGSAATAPTPESAPAPSFDIGIDDDDPYADQFSTLAQQLTSSQRELQDMKKQFGDFALNSQRASLSSQVDDALTNQNVPDVLKDSVRQVVYAYMAQSSDAVSPAPLIENWMQSLSKHVESERKDWAKDAGRSKRMAALGGAPGVLMDKPKSWEEAKEASFAVLMGQSSQ